MVRLQSQLRRGKLKVYAILLPLSTSSPVPSRLVSSICLDDAEAIDAQGLTTNRLTQTQRGATPKADWNAEETSVES